jgi:hypothetical protein
VPCNRRRERLTGRAGVDRRAVSLAVRQLQALSSSAMLGVVDRDVGFEVGCAELAADAVFQTAGKTIINRAARTSSM